MAMLVITRLGNLSFQLDYSLIGCRSNFQPPKICFFCGSPQLKATGFFGGSKWSWNAAIPPTIFRHHPLTFHKALGGVVYGIGFTRSGFPQPFFKSHSNPTQNLPKKNTNKIPWKMTRCSRKMTRKWLDHLLKSYCLNPMEKLPWVHPPKMPWSILELGHTHDLLIRRWQGHFGRFRHRDRGKCFATRPRTADLWGEIRHGILIFGSWLGLYWKFVWDYVGISWSILGLLGLCGLFFGWSGLFSGSMLIYQRVYL